MTMAEMERLARDLAPGVVEVWHDGERFRVRVKAGSAPHG